jgi:hypothetical protein
MWKIRHAFDHKRRVFDELAQQCMQFYNGPRSWDELMGSNLTTLGGINAEEGFPSPDFKVVVNKTFEFVTIFGPTLYYENPVRVARPRMPVTIPPDFFPNPQVYQSLMAAEDQQMRIGGLRGVLLETLLNYIPFEFDLAKESRRAIDEALIKGRGCIWSELYIPPGTNWKLVRSQYDTVDHLFCDVDAPRFEDCKWIARRRIHPVWQVERDYNLRRGSLRGNFESMSQQANIMLDENLLFDRKRGFTNDLLVYYQLWSKMGVGGRLSGMSTALRGPLEMFGDYVYLVVAENTPFPLNCSPDVTADPSFGSDPSVVFEKFAWPTPFWANEKWPVTVLDFHDIPNCPWPMAHLKAAMGELKFLNWAMSWLMGRLRTSARDFLVVFKGLTEGFKDALLRGEDLTMLELEAEYKGTPIEQLVTFLKHPEINADFWKIIQIVEEWFNKRSGLSDVLYGEGTGTQIRSAEEYAGRNQNASIRPEDMANRVEAWMSEVAQKEALTARYHLRSDDVRPIVGAAGSIAWDQYVATMDYEEAARQMEYRVEAGSTRRPNKEYEARTVNDMWTAVAPFLQQYAAQTGDVRPINNLLADMARSRALDPERYVIVQGLPQPQPAQPELHGDQPHPGVGMPNRQPVNGQPSGQPSGAA